MNHVPYDCFQPGERDLESHQILLPGGMSQDTSILLMTVPEVCQHNMFDRADGFVVQIFSLMM